MSFAALKVTSDELDVAFRSRFGELDRTGKLPRLWHRLGYYTPDIYYETIVARLAVQGCSWLDVGCGRCPFPENEQLARFLAQRCDRVVGVDPDVAVRENDLVHERVQTTLENFESPQPFDVVTLRMVAEHITHPASAVKSLAKLTRPGGKVVIYTINRWSPVSLVAWMVPFRFHHAIKSVLWGTKEEDTFPVAYQMNTRRTLRRLFEADGFREVQFARLSDCRTFFRILPLHYLELSIWSVLRAFGLSYPENCLLSVFQRCEQNH